MILKKVLLVDPTFNPGNIPPNIGLGRIEAAIENESQIMVEAVDFVVLGKPNLTLSEFRKEEKNFIARAVDAAENASVVYISGSHGMEMKPYAMFPRIRDVTQAIKEAHPSTKIIFGGALANLYRSVMKMPSDKFKHFGIDLVTEGQELNAAESILQACGIDLRKSNLTRDFGANSILKWSAWDLSKYPSYISTVISTGCPHKCSFCFEGKVYSPKNLQNTPDGIIASLAEIERRHPINGIMIEDSIALSYSWFEGLAQTLAGVVPSWAIYARSNEIIKNASQLGVIREAGCRSLIVGIEALDDKELKASNKKLTTLQTLEALDLARAHDLAVQGCFILGFPDDTAHKIEDRIVSALKLDLDTYRWHVLQPDWLALPSTILGLEGFVPEDHFNQQVSIPDSCIAEYVDSGPPSAIYDEHLLVRLMPTYTGIDRLAEFGYKGQFSLKDLMDVASPLIQKAGLTTNEDEMYPFLFEPRKASSRPVLAP